MVTVRQAAIAVDARWLRRHGDRPLLAWILHDLCRFGVTEALLLSDLAADIAALVPPLPLPMRLIQCPPDDISRMADRLLFCDGAAWLGLNVARLLADAAADGAGAPGRLLRRAGEAASGLAVLQREAVPRRVGLPATILDGPAWQERPRRALFLDRDGVINHDHGYVGEPARFQFIDGAIATTRAAADAGWQVFVVTNQSGIARGRYDEAQFAALTGWMIDRIRAEGGNIDDVRYCPTHPDAPLEAYRRVDRRRKPGPGMLEELLAAWALDPACCRLIGDQPTDLQAAAACGVPGHLFPGGDLLDFAGPLLA